MTIRFLKDSIEFDDYVLNTTPTGFRFSGEIQARQFYNLFQGTIAGYNSGGDPPGTLQPAVSNAIERFPFATDSNSVAQPNALVTAVAGAAGISSRNFGYSAGGYLASPPITLVSTTPVQKFSFISNITSVTVGSLVQAAGYISGHSSAYEGFTSGGDTTTGSYANFIQKFPFANDASATYAGTLSSARRGTAGMSSTIRGYTGGGENATVVLVSTIDRFSLNGTETISTSVGDLSQGRRRTAGCSSTTNGYIVGGSLGAAVFTAAIDKFPFANEGNSTLTASLTANVGSTQGSQSSNTSGYSSGGFLDGSILTNRIEKFSFVTDTSATFVGNLSQAKRSLAGHNY